MRPELTVFITGTGTEVGKTWTGARLLRSWQRTSAPVSARKPVQSFDPASPVATDADVLAAATGEAADDVCHPEHSYPLPMAPPMAAAELGRRCPTVAELALACEFPASTRIGLIEGVGGLFSPVGADGDNLDLIIETGPHVVVLVADADLGAIHAVRACTRALVEHGVHHVVILNRFRSSDRLHDLNRAWLLQAGIAVTTSTGELVDSIGAQLPSSTTLRSASEQDAR